MYKVNAAQKRRLLDCWQSASLVKMGYMYEQRHFSIKVTWVNEAWVQQTQEEEEERNNLLSLESSLSHLSPYTQNKLLLKNIKSIFNIHTKIHCEKLVGKFTK